MKRNALQPSASLNPHARWHAWIESVVVRSEAFPEERERGDVPGWVMITLMSAILVAGLLALATPALEDLFTQAMERVGK